MSPPLYTSKSMVKSLWQEYRIYADRLELDTLFGPMVVPFEQIERVELRPSDVACLFRGELQLENFRPALKLDWANFLEHVVIDKKEGFVRRILLTPDDPPAFARVLEEALARRRERPAE